MKSILLSVLGLVLGAITNGFLVQVGNQVIAPPKGFDLTTDKGLAAAISHFEPMRSVHLWVPFLSVKCA
jgi:hypothetical protein